MGWNGLERNKLDYILTDLLPVEVSELFSFSQLYAFLLEKDTQKVVDSLICETKQNKAKGKLAMFKDGWSTKPLKYRILKGNGTMRENEYYSTCFCVEFVSFHRVLPKRNIELF